MRKFFKDIKKALQGMKTALEGAKVVLQEVIETLEGQLVICGKR